MDEIESADTHKRQKISHENNDISFFLNQDYLSPRERQHLIQGIPKPAVGYVYPKTLFGSQKRAFQVLHPI